MANERRGGDTRVVCPLRTNVAVDVLLNIGLPTPCGLKSVIAGFRRRCVRYADKRVHPIVEILNVGLGSGRDPSPVGYLQVPLSPLQLHCSSPTIEHWFDSASAEDDSGGGSHHGHYRWRPGSLAAGLWEQMPTGPRVPITVGAVGPRNVTHSHWGGGVSVVGHS